MLIGIIGAPNKGKSLFFSCLTSTKVAVADYPFTTIDPNRGVAMLRVKCAHAQLGLKKCDARGGHCKDGWREIAIPLLDVAGLVPKASEGRGMGNQFLDDLKAADGFIQVIDASGRTDLDGKPTQMQDMKEEIEFLKKELAMWLSSILERNEHKFKHKTIRELAEAISGLGYSSAQIKSAAAKCSLNLERIEWSREEIQKFAFTLWELGKPMVIAANKADLPGALERIKKISESAGNIVPCSALYEHALEKAAKSGLIKYTPGDPDFEIVGKASQEQEQALRQIKEFMKENGGCGVHAALYKLVFKQLKMIVVYPVEDENHYTDKKGAILPDALLVKQGTTAHQLASIIHTDLAKNFIGAIDAKTKRRVGKDYLLQDGDIIKIIASR
jgi:ribosome-binding ATPase YchF (GTP1/OBG family)